MSPIPDDRCRREKVNDKKVLPAAVASPPPCKEMSREWRMVHKGTGHASSRPMSKEEIEGWTVSFPDHYEMQTRLVTPWTGVSKQASETLPNGEPAADQIDILAELRKALDLRKTLAQGASADVPPQAE